MILSIRLLKFVCICFCRFESAIASSKYKDDNDGDEGHVGGRVAKKALIPVAIVAMRRRKNFIFC